MPYITPERRLELARHGPNEIENEGELNYAIHDLIERYLLKKKTDYATCNGIIGVLECAKLEFYRRLVAPYEDSKIALNGDVPVYEELNGQPHSA